MFQSYKKLQTEIEQSRFKCTDIERAERQVRVDLEQLSKKVGAASGHWLSIKQKINLEVLELPMSFNF